MWSGVFYTYDHHQKYVFLDWVDGATYMHIVLTHLSLGCCDWAYITDTSKKQLS